jgi:hypothetical protein
MSIKSIEGTESVRHLVLPATGALSEDELAAVDGGVMVRPGQAPRRMIGRDRIWNQVISRVRLGDPSRDAGRPGRGARSATTSSGGCRPGPRGVRPPARSRGG